MSKMSNLQQALDLARLVPGAKPIYDQGISALLTRKEQHEDPDELSKILKSVQATIQALSLQHSALTVEASPGLVSESLRNGEYPLPSYRSPQVADRDSKITEFTEREALEPTAALEERLNRLSGQKTSTPTIEPSKQTTRPGGRGG